MSYFASIDHQLVGSAAFKGGPKAGKVEIAYGTFPAYQRRGIGLQTCRQLVLLALRTDRTVQITARTADAGNYALRILAKNGFVRTGTV